MKRMRTLGILVAVLLFIAIGSVVTLFLVKNDQWVSVRFPIAELDFANPVTVAEFEAPLAVVMLVCFIAGLLLTTLLLVPGWLRRALEHGREQRFIHALEGELTDLRNLPVTDPAPLEDIDDEAVHDDDDEREERARDDDESLMLLGLGDGPDARDRGRRDA